MVGVRYIAYGIVQLGQGLMGYKSPQLVGYCRNVGNGGDW